MGLISIEVLCEKCDERYGMLVERDKRNEPQLCDKCGGGHAHRVWSVPHVSTEKTSASIPDVTAKGRFDDVREYSAARKNLSKAKADYVKNPSLSNRDNLDRARKEKKKS